MIGTQLIYTCRTSNSGSSAQPSVVDLADNERKHTTNLPTSTRVYRYAVCFLRREGHTPRPWRLLKLWPNWATNNRTRSVIDRALPKDLREESKVLRIPGRYLCLPQEYFFSPAVGFAPDMPTYFRMELHFWAPVHKRGTETWKTLSATAPCLHTPTCTPPTLGRYSDRGKVGRLGRAL
ncbi:hypothetical protein BR93DRAFT_810738 [Coniochaeta sp. PMI_546]|nr:hypothetical protein BR93DRAFT_810738 [Coniochaeta sp. PMI_546]